MDCSCDILAKKVFRIYGEKTFTNVVQETAGGSTLSYGGLANSLSSGLDANQYPFTSPNKIETLETFYYNEVKKPAG